MVGIFLATVIGVVAVDLLTGILIGLVLSAFLLMYRMSDLELIVEDEGEGEDDTLGIRIIGAATFLALPRFAELFDSLPAGRVVRVHFNELTFIDHACLDQIGVFKGRYDRAGGTVLVEWDQLKDHYARGPKSVSETGEHATLATERKSAVQGLDEATPSVD